MAIETYADYLSGGGKPLFANKDTGRGDGQKKVRCDCGGWDWPFMLVDVRRLPALLTGGYLFACGGCVGTWQRTLKPFASGDDFLHWSEWRVEWVRRHGVTDVTDENRVAVREMGRAAKLADAINRTAMEARIALIAAEIAP